MATTPYGERVLQSILVQCSRRGIPSEEFDSVLAHIAERAGKSVTKMNGPELKRVQQHLAEHFATYLDGEKRRGGDAVWGTSTPEEALARAKGGAGVE
jgi:hypothetical protein